MISSYLNFVSIAFFLVLGLFFLSKKQTTSQYLGVLMLVQGVANAILWFNNSAFVSYFPYFIFVALSLRFLWGPMLFLFVKSALRQNISRTLLHFLPFVGVFIYLVYQTILLSQTDLVEIVTKKNILFSRYKIFNFAIYFQNITYILMCILAVFKYQSNLFKQFSNHEKIKLNWLFNTLVVLALVHFMIPIIFLYLDLQYFKNLYLIQLPVLLYISWNTWRQPQILEQTDLVETNTAEILSEKIIDKKEVLIKIMEIQMPFLNTELTIKNLAELIELPPYQVSELINKGFNKNFYDFVNYFRIEEAKMQLLNPKNDNLTLEGIGNNCGFKSKSTFFAIFKKITGYTPSEFRNRQKSYNQ
jgi:AraC-like DNA-binding protein